jgi:hypothetical protein
MPTMWRNLPCGRGFVRGGIFCITLLTFGSVIASPSNTDMNTCDESQTSIELRNATVCVASGINFTPVADGHGDVFSIAIKNYDTVVADAPHGTHDAALFARRFVQPDPQRLVRADRPFVRALHEGRLTYLQPEGLTLFGAPFLLRCGPALAPHLSEQGAESCILFARFDDSLSVEVRLGTIIWQGEPAWPALDGNAPNSWIAPLERLEHALGATFLVIGND